MENLLYLECYGGISGDMAVAALLDLGADQQALERALESLPLDEFSTKISRVKKAGLDACDFEVILRHGNHDHDMEYLHGSKCGHYEESSHCEEDGHFKEDSHCEKDGHCEGDRQMYGCGPKCVQECHAHQHVQGIHAHQHVQECHARHHSHCGLSDILPIIQQADMTERAKHTAAEIFTILGRAEAKAHGTSLENVHFHEIGAVDSIVDIVSVAVCLDSLNISQAIIPALHEGTGTVRCQHGILPVPVPATANIIQAHHIPLEITDAQGEFVTPTGAAIVAAIRTGGQLPKHFCILRIGLGAGKRTYERPSILRAMLIEPSCSQDTETIFKLETDIDDCTGEALGYVFECLMAAGARDVHYFPVYMKKNRPAYQLNVLCIEEDIPKLEQIIFRQTTTIGIRRLCMERSILPRETMKLQTAYGEVQAKACTVDGQVRIYPEYESVARICRQTGSPYPETYLKLQEICRGQLP